MNASVNGFPDGGPDPTPEAQEDPVEPALWRGLLTDRWIGASAAVAVALGVALTQVREPDRVRLSGLGAVVLALVAWHALSRPVKPQIRRLDDSVFWQDLSFAVALGLCSGVLWLTPPEVWTFSDDGLGALRRDRAAQVLSVLSYTGLFLAVERQPHRRHRWRPLELERRLLLAAVWVVVPSLVVYSLLAGLPSDLGAVESPWVERGGALLLGGYLTTRQIDGARRTWSRRWRSIYLILAAALAVRLAGDVVLAAAPVASWLEPLTLAASHLALTLAARVRHRPDGVDRAAAPESPLVAGTSPGLRPESNLPGPLGATMIFAVLLAAAHLAAGALGMLDPAFEPRRAAVVSLTLVFLAGLAFYQHRLLARSTRQLREEYERSVRRFHEIERDLRAHSRRRKERASLSASQEAFARAFQACPDVIAIAAEGDGRLLDVNTSFFDVFGVSRTDAVGHTLSELGVWADPIAFRDRIDALRGDGAPRVFEGAIRRGAGRKGDWVSGRGLFFAAAIEIEGQPYVLLMVRDVTRAERYRDELERSLRLLTGARVAVAAVDSSGHVRFWNGGAERLFGIAAKSAVGRPWKELAGAEELCDHVGTEAPVSLTLTRWRAGDGPVDVEAHAVPVLDRGLGGGSTLFVLSPRRPALGGPHA